jgi:uncharacterized protein (TIGR02145 family)
LQKIPTLCKIFVYFFLKWRIIMKTQRITRKGKRFFAPTLTASIALVIVFIFSCSENDNDTSEGSNGTQGGLGAQNIQGPIGPSGTSCEIKTSATVEHDYEIFCGNVFVGYLDNGKKGDSGDSGVTGAQGEQGPSGTSCEIKTSATVEHDYEIFCGNVFIGYLDNGQQGIQGTTGPQGGQGQQGIQGPTGPQGGQGANGTSCDVEEDGVFFVMSCGGEERARWAKAYCGAIPYDPAFMVCNNGSFGEPGTGLCTDFVNGIPRMHYGRNKAQFCDPRDGKKYVYVPIGNQIWMAENLNYVTTEGSKCGSTEVYGFNPSDYFLKDANTEICDKYGRLYNWATAMGLDPSYNSVTAGSLSPTHKGICPEGWHIPTNAEWDELLRYTDGTTGAQSPYISPVAGKHLRATGEWKDYGTYSSLDSHGFAALPGGAGYFYSNGESHHSGLDMDGHWWGATEGNMAKASELVIQYSDLVSYTDNSKTSVFSVRCVKN